MEKEKKEKKKLLHKQQPNKEIRTNENH